jgi:hypothetical protein
VEKSLGLISTLKIYPRWVFIRKVVLLFGDRRSWFLIRRHLIPFTCSKDREYWEWWIADLHNHNGNVNLRKAVPSTLFLDLERKVESIFDFCAYSFCILSRNQTLQLLKVVQTYWWRALPRSFDRIWDLCSLQVFFCILKRRIQTPNQIVTEEWDRAQVVHRSYVVRYATTMRLPKEFWSHLGQIICVSSLWRAQTVSVSKPDRRKWRDRCKAVSVGSWRRNVA